MHDVQRILDDTAAAPATLGAGRLICIDGPAGSGKTTLAARLAALAPSAVVLHVDDLLAGWHGLATVAETLRRVFAPLAGGAAGRWRRWDWHADRWAEWHEVAPGPLVLLEGVGSAAHTLEPWITTVVWVEAPSALRLQRGLERDGEELRPQWLTWRREEDALHAEEHTVQRAHFRVDGVSGEIVVGDRSR